MFKGYHDLVFADREDVQESLRFYKEWNNYLRLISEIFEIDIQANDILSGLDNENFISSFLKSYLEEDKIGQALFDRFGVELFLFYELLNYSLALNYTLSFITSIEKDLSSLKKDYVHREYNYAKNYLKKFYDNLSVSEHIKLKYFSKAEVTLLDEVVSLLKNEGSVNEISKKLGDYIGEIMVSHLGTDFNLKISRLLIENLEKCKSGTKNWQEYEEVAFDIMKFLFLPQFQYLFKQARNEDNHQVRDIVIPNYQDAGFFKDIKNEFDSKNIVIETKNGASKALNKDALNQLRIYLSKKTIGRFGMLLVRKLSNQSISKAQKLAYEESNILILVIDDEKLKKLIQCKALLGSCEHYLYKLKMDFEIDY
jgi:hypothetical protein